jgi:penicillin-binding protein 1A
MVLAGLAVAVTGCAVYASMASQLPDPDPSKARGRDQTTVVYDRDGKVLVRLYAEENRADVPLAKMPQHLRQAVVATEDRRFYEHEGVDPMGIARALAVDIARGETAQGGSTITQQYVKQAFVTSEKTLKRKVQEAILAQKVESRYSKEEILERYLNTIYFGHGAYGVESASRTYFGKSVSDLSLAESAVLAGVIKSPRRYSPYLEPENAMRRRNVVLAQMLDQGYIDAAAHAEAAAAPIKLAGLKSRAARAPYFVEWVKEQLVERFGERQVYRGGLRVHTTLDPTAQKAAEKAISSILGRKGDPSAALVAVKPGTGEILALVGGRDFSAQQFNVAIDGKRQPGSAFKPFVLATALAEGVSPEQPFKSGPARLKVGSQTWNVTGVSGGGTMRLRPATERSVNSVFARLILDVGAEDVVKTAESMGVGKGIEPVPAIALGGLRNGVSPLEMATAYATLAANGRRAQPFALTSVEGPDGASLYRSRVRRTQAIDPAVAYLTTDVLKGVISRGTGTAASIGRPAAGKTGTTQEYRDAWFVGYTPDISTAVWVGYPDAQREMTSVHGRAVTGGSFPAQIWARFMRAALSDVDKHAFRKPPGLSRVKLCAETGGTVTEYCPNPFSALVLTASKPKPCTVHTVPVEVTIPKLVGLTKEDALAKIERLGLVASVTEKALSGVAAGIVGQQNPSAGTVVSAESTVTLVVATGGGADNPPVARFSIPAGAVAGEPVKLDASESSDDGSIKVYYWEFGDGKNGTGVKQSHTWTAPGDFEVTLWVTDDAGQQGSVTQVVSVR